MSITEFTKKLTDPAFIGSLPQDARNIRELVQSFAGAGWYFGQILEEAGETKLAILFFEAQLDTDSVYFLPSLERLLRLRLRLQQYEEIIDLSTSIARSRQPDPAEASWFYTHRFDSFIQLDKADKAFAEMVQLLVEHPDLFASPDLPHGLLYYRALIAALAADPAELDKHILPYAILASARAGHKEVFTILKEGLGTEASQLDAYPWLKVKVLLMDGDYDQSLATALEAFGDRRHLSFLLDGYQPAEGIFRDVFRASQESGRRGEVLSLFNHLIMDIPVDNMRGEELAARFLEYSGQLLVAAGPSTQAAATFEQAFFVLKNLWEEASGSSEADVAFLALLSLKRERLLWRWISALMEDNSVVARASMYRAFSWVRNPDYFYDISDAYISRLFRSQQWDLLDSFVQAAGAKFPPFLLHSTRGIIQTLQERGIYQFSGTALATSTGTSSSSEEELRPQYSAESFLNQMLFLQEPILKTDILNSVFAQERYLSYTLSGLAASQLPSDRAQGFTQVIHGFGLVGLFRRAAQYLSLLPPAYVADPMLIIELVNMSYAAENWYAGLNLLETAIGRSYRYGDGPGDIIAAAGGLDSLFRLMYPLAYLQQMKRIALQYDVDPYLFLSLMREESRFNPRAGSSVGALGLGQIIPQTAEDIAGRMRLESYDLFSPEDNMTMSLYYISYLNSRFSTTWEMLAAYNAGQGRVDRWNEELPDRHLPGFVFLSHVPFAETRAYLRRVINAFITYHYLYSPAQQIDDIITDVLIPQQRTSR